MLSLWTSHPSSFTPQPYMLSMNSHSVEYSWGQLSQLYPHPALCAPPVHSLVGCPGKQKRPQLCLSTAQQKQKDPCYQWHFHTNPNHSRIQPTAEKINYPSQNQHVEVDCGTQAVLHRHLCSYMSPIEAACCPFPFASFLAFFVDLVDSNKDLQDTEFNHSSEEMLTQQPVWISRQWRKWAFEGLIALYVFITLWKEHIKTMWWKLLPFPIESRWSDFQHVQSTIKIFVRQFN